jgi:hypothetical protein
MKKRKTIPQMRISSAVLGVIAFILLLALGACMPEREYVQFSDAGTFHPGPAQGGGDGSGPQGEYDSYELIDHGAPNHGIAPMYQGYQQGYQQPHRGHHGRGYPAVVETYDQYGNPRNVIVPNPW